MGGGTRDDAARGEAALVNLSARRCITGVTDVRIVKRETHAPGSELLQGGRPLKQHAVGFLFRLLLFHWRFPIYLSDQVIEDLRGDTGMGRRGT